ncbi:hypothetical protein WJX74_005518 [Apatococcus lobatus]|uniref:Uncharacterized protein n=1 Tax=Apatococcus lobatus TaxID=904363 RepID=A0AAW1RN55_9CHLO
MPRVRSSVSAGAEAQQACNDHLHPHHPARRHMFKLWESLPKLGNAKPTQQAPDQSRYIAKGPQPMLGNEMPSREDFQLANATCILWDPETMWPAAKLRRCMKCPSCKSSKRVQADGHSDVRRVISRTGSAFVMTRKYRCKGCPGKQASTAVEVVDLEDAAMEEAPHKRRRLSGAPASSTFLAYSPHVMAQLPRYVHDSLNIIFTHRSAVESKFIDEITHRVSRGLSFAEAADEIHAGVRRQFSADSCSYADFYRQNNAEPPDFGHPLDGEHLWSPSFLVDVWLEAIEPVVRWSERHMATITGKILCSDHTFRSAKYIRDSHHKRVYDAFFTVMNECGQVMGQWLTSGQSHAEIKPGLQSVINRFPPGRGPEIMYVDNARASAPSLEKMMAGVRVLDDPTHLMRRFIRACPSGHSLIGEFAKGLSDAIFQWHAPDKLAMVRRLQAENDNEPKPRKWWTRRCRRIIPAKEQLAENLKNLMDRDWKDASGRTLKTPELLDVYANALINVNENRVSDPYDVEEMFINISSDPENPHWVAFRGCSKGEGYHPGLHATFKGNNYTPSMARAMVAVHNLRHNITCGQRFFGLPDHGWEIWREDPDFSPHIVDSGDTDSANLGLLSLPALRNTDVIPPDDILPRPDDGRDDVLGGADPDVNDLLQELPTSGNVPSSQGLHGRSESHADAGSNLSSASTPRHAHLRPSVAPSSTPEETKLRETAKQFGILWGWTYQESVHQQGSCGLCKRPLSEAVNNAGRLWRPCHVHCHAKSPGGVCCSALGQNWVHVACAFQSAAAGDDSLQDWKADLTFSIFHRRLAEVSMTRFGGLHLLAQSSPGRYLTPPLRAQPPQMAATGVFKNEGSQPSISNHLNGTMDQNRGPYGPAWTDCDPNRAYAPLGAQQSNPGASASACLGSAALGSHHQGGHDDWQSLGPDIVHDALQPVRPQSDDECPEQSLPGLPTPVPTRCRRICTDHVNQDAHHSPAHEGTCLHGVSAAHRVSIVTAAAASDSGLVAQHLPCLGDPSLGAAMLHSSHPPHGQQASGPVQSATRHVAIGSNGTHGISPPISRPPGVMPLGAEMTGQALTSPAMRDNMADARGPLPCANWAEGVQRQLVGFSDPVYAEKLNLELATMGDLKLVERPQNYALRPHGQQNIRANIKVSSTETGAIFGNIFYESTGHSDRSVVVLNDIHIDIMDYISPASCPDVQFRSMWAEFEWENKVAVNTTINDVNSFLKHIVSSTNTKCLTPPSALDGECGFLAANLYAKSVFGEDALVNVSVEKGLDGKLAGYIRIRSKTQGIALSLGDKLILKQKG